MSGTQPATQSKRDVQQQPAVGDEEVNAPPPASDDEVDDGKQQKGQVPPPPAQPAVPLQGTQSAAQQSPPPRQVVIPSLEDQVRAIIDRSDTIMSCMVDMEGKGQYTKLRQLRRSPQGPDPSSRPWQDQRWAPEGDVG